MTATCPLVAELRRRLRSAGSQEVVAILKLEKRRMRTGQEPDFQPVALPPSAD